MRFISPRVHGALDYGVAAVLIGAPLVRGFAGVSIAAAVIAIGGGLGLLAYSLLTDYSAGVRALIPFRRHLILDTIAALTMLAAPFLLGFEGEPRAFYLTIGTAVLAVVACTQPEGASERATDLQRATATRAS